MSRGLISFFGCAAADLVQGNPQSLIVPFRLHQVSGAFRHCAAADLVQGNPQSLIVPFRLHQVSGAFRHCAAADLVQGNTQSLIVPFRLHQVSGAFRRCAAADLVQGNTQSLIVPFRLHQVSGAFRRCAAADLVQGNPQSLIVPFRLHQVSGAFRRCAPCYYQTNANEYTIIPAINEINSVILTKSFAGTSLLLHIYCISSEASIPTIQDRINTIIPDLFVAYAIAKEHNAITATEVIILFFFIYATSIACNMTLLLFM